MQKNKLLLLGLFAFPLSSYYGQNVNQNLISSSGDHYTSGSAQLSWSLGEVSIEPYSSGSTILTQGFHQPESSLSVSVNEIDFTSQINVYPNPVIDLLTIDFGRTTNESNNIQLFDSNGKLIYNSSNQLNYQTIDMSLFSAGNYILKLSNKNLELKSFKIIK